MFSFDKSVIEVVCPLCKFPNAVTVREVRFGLTIPCRGCKRNICLVPMEKKNYLFTVKIVDVQI